MVLKHRVAFCSAIIIAVVLMAAAMGKIFFPPEEIEWFYFSIGMLEIGLIACLLIFFKKWITWILLALIFASWGGYAFFWMSAHLPCSCMGSRVEFPPQFSFYVDVVFWGLTTCMGYLLGASRIIVRMILIASFFLGWGGYELASFVFKRIDLLGN